MGFAKTQIILEVIGDREFRLRWALVYKGHTDTFIIPAGFKTDLASVPQVFQWLVDDHAAILKAALLHDYLYSLVRKGEFSQRDADGILRRVLHEEGVPLIRRNLIWGAVRAGGHFKDGMSPEELEQFIALLPIGVVVLACTALPLAFREALAAEERMELKWQDSRRTARTTRLSFST
jgi:hypothetical protein